jgi:predicted TIM-barrel fold metal-dependent hydrolase
VTDRLDWLISVDDHVIEPPNLWVDRVAAKFRDVAPHVERIDNVDTWVYERHRTPISGIMVTGGFPPGRLDAQPVNYDELRKSCYDPVARLASMDVDGVLASLNFPNFPRFCGQVFLETSDKELALICLRVYNDWMIDEWCGVDPGRFLPLILIPFWDPVLAVEEIERCAGKGAKAIAFSENPAPLGLPSLHDVDRYWDPVFSAAEETGMPICTHLGSSSAIPTTASDAPMAINIGMLYMNLAGPLLDWLFSGQLLRHPKLKVALAEGGIGWIPYVLEKATRMVNLFYYLREAQDDSNWPSDPVELFRGHIYGCFVEDFLGTRNLDLIGIDNVMIETDYPHRDSPWPKSVTAAHAALEGRTDADKLKVFQENAMRVFNFVPGAIPSEAQVRASQAKLDPADYDAPFLRGIQPEKVAAAGS